MERDFTSLAARVISMEGLSDLYVTHPYLQYCWLSYFGSSESNDPLDPGPISTWGS